MVNQYVWEWLALVKLAFIVEGATEKIFIESAGFQTLLADNDVNLVRPVIDAKGGGNLLPKYLEPHVDAFAAQNPDCIVVLTDLEQEDSVQAVQERIGQKEQLLVFVSVKAIEAWFLADTKALSKWLKTTEEVYEEKPEQTIGMPWERLKEIAAELGKRGPGGSKVSFAKQFTKHHQFSLERAAQHRNCPSATAFYGWLVNFRTVHKQ